MSADEQIVEVIGPVAYSRPRPCDRCEGYRDVGPGLVVSTGEYDWLCRPCWWQLRRWGDS